MNVHSRSRKTNLAFHDEGNVSGAGKQSAGETSLRFRIQILSTELRYRFIPFNAAPFPIPISDVLFVSENPTWAFWVLDTTGRQPFWCPRRARYSVAFFPSKVMFWDIASSTSET